MNYKNQYVKKRRILCLLLVVLLVTSLVGTVAFKKEARGQTLLQVKSGQELLWNRETNFNSSQLMYLESETEEPLETDLTGPWFELLLLGQDSQKTALEYYWRSDRNIHHLFPIPLKIVGYIHQTDGKKGFNHCFNCFM